MERNRGLGTVAVVCTMAGVASGLALATTLMAMQVADTMATRSCPYERMELRSIDARQEQGLLGVVYVMRNGVARVQAVVPGTPAQAVALQPGDAILSVNGESIDRNEELQLLITSMRPGSRATLLVEREGKAWTIRPTLISRASVQE